jgi:hypothetical protein
VRHEERDSAGRLLSQTLNSDFQKLGETGVWLPTGSVVTSFHPMFHPERVHEDPVYSEIYEVSLLDNKMVDEATFRLQYKVGTWVTDSTDGTGEVTYQMPANAALMDTVIEDARRKTQFERTVNIRWIIVVANVCLFSLLAVAWGWRQYSLKHARSRGQ